MKRNLTLIAAALFSVFLLSVEHGHAFSSIGNNVDSFCSPRGVTPFGGTCTLCHIPSPFTITNPVNFDAALNGDFDQFCPLPACTDSDGDGYAVEGGGCGPVDCNDTDPGINPNEAENCTDGLDNNCNGLVDNQDPGAVACPPVCTDSDLDGFSVEGGACGPVDCDDSKSTTNPGDAEICDDGVDNNCNGIIDENCGPVCTDNDGDGFSVEGGACGQVDCNDSVASINPNGTEICGDGVDNNCNNVTDETCAPVPTCTDSDGDGFSVEGGDCGNVDCDDSDASVFPGAVENCTDGIDNNCNNLIDTQDTSVCEQPGVCTDSDGDTYAVEGGDCGPVDCDDSNAANSPGSAELCNDGEDNDCDSLVDEGCEPTCPDADGDTYQSAVCGGADCDDNNPAINPGTGEIIDNGVDENCNGMSDDVCTTCPDGNPDGNDDSVEDNDEDDDDDDRYERYRHRDRDREEDDHGNYDRSNDDDDDDDDNDDDDDDDDEDDDDDDDDEDSGR